MDTVYQLTMEPHSPEEWVARSYEIAKQWAERGIGEHAIEGTDYSIQELFIYDF